MKHLVLWQLDPEITLCSGESVAEAEVGNTVNENTEFQDNVAGGNLLVQGAGLNAGGDPRRQGGRIETEFFNTVTAQHRSEA
jgi:hypothetical protein